MFNRRLSIHLEAKKRTIKCQLHLGCHELESTLYAVHLLPTLAGFGKVPVQDAEQGEEHLKQQLQPLMLSSISSMKAAQSRSIGNPVAVCMTLPEAIAAGRLMFWPQPRRCAAGRNWLDNVS
jgi:hypothetical protein